jgi:hypothetical protein
VDLWAFIDNAKTRFERGKITVSEMWYGPSDDDYCCPSITAETVWGYDGTTLSAKSTVSGTRQVPRVRPEDFVGHWRVHGAQLDIIFGNHAMETISNAGTCTADPMTFCYERRALNLTPSHDGQTMLVTVAAVAYFTPDGTLSRPPPDAIPEIGDTFRLEFVFPNLLKATTLHTRDPAQPDGLGNPYLCREGLAREVGGACGA